MCDILYLGVDMVENSWKFFVICIICEKLRSIEI